MSQPRSPRTVAPRKSTRLAPANAPTDRPQWASFSPVRAPRPAPKSAPAKSPFANPNNASANSKTASAYPKSTSGNPKSASAKPNRPAASPRPAVKRAVVELPAFPGARISRRASDRIRAGHLWVYTSDIEALQLPQGDVPALLPVADNRGLLLGTALYSPSSLIALRLVSRGEIDEAQWLDLLATRLRAAIALRKPLLATRKGLSTDSLRLCFSEADDLPGLVIDKYAGLVVLQILARGLDSAAVRSRIVDVLKEELVPIAILERPDPRIRELEGLSAPNLAPLWAADADAPVTNADFQINGLKLHFDANAGQKTGAFLDQRENYAAARDWAVRLGATGRALDVCTYQGGFALHLGQVCKQVVGIDSSRPSLEVAEKNAAANQKLLKAEFEWVEGDAFEILRGWSQSGERYDTIVLDPPAFAKSIRAVESALRGYKELNLRALRMLRPGGLLVTCSCSHHVSWTDLEAAVTSAAADAGRRVRLLERRGAAQDHPVVLNLPESEYLKCLILQAE